MIMEQKEILEKIEKEISRVVPSTVDESWIKSAIGKNSFNMTEFSVDNINAPCLELVNRGGKRWRPLVLVLTTAALSGDIDLAIKLSPLVELIHNGTLLIDDIEDKAIERRGKKAVHLIYGDDMTINSGNHLYFIPTTIIETLSIEDLTKLKIYQSYTENMRRLHFGQGLDIQWHNNLEMIPTVDQYMQMCRFKTGCLASMSGELGAIVAQCDKELYGQIRAVWEDIGVGFQILDDIKNITTGNPGKHRGDDIVEGKKSLPVIMHCNKTSYEHLLDAIKHAQRYGIIEGSIYIEEAITILEKSNSIKEASDFALNMLNNCIERLKKLIPENNYREQLINLLYGFIDKMSLK